MLNPADVGSQSSNFMATRRFKYANDFLARAIPEGAVAYASVFSGVFPRLGWRNRNAQVQWSGS